MADFFAELKRRQIYRVGAAYVVVAWALTQVVEILAQVFTLPLWMAQVAIVLLAIGFPVALFITWTIENKPHEAVASAVRSKPTIVDWTLCGALAVVMLLIGYDRIAPRETSLDAARSTSTNPGGAISLAVLPFVNLSGDPNQEFFSDGITAEITAALAKVPNLRVVARTSAFEFKGQNRDMRAVGQTLGASHLIEGSVRKDGNQLRITAELVKADDGTHVWTEIYDRELRAVFAVQEEIARAIAASLRVPLGLQRGETLVSNRTGDTESYQDYLRAKALVRARGAGNSLPDAITLLEHVVERDLSYAPAWALLAQASALAPSFAPQDSADEFRPIAEAALSKAETAASRAIELDGRNADAYTALGDVRAFRGRFVEAEELFRQALALDPLSPDALNAYSRSLAELGRVKEAVAIRQQLRSLEPFVPVFNLITGRYLWVDGQHEAALVIANALPADFVLRPVEVAWIHASMGRLKEAADVLSAMPAGTYSSVVDAAVQLLRTAPARTARQGTPYLGYLSFAHLYTDAPERSLEQSELLADAGYNIMMVNASLWHSSYAVVRKTERFKALMRKAGLVDYWRAKGWPDLCRPVGADDFVCE